MLKGAKTLNHRLTKRIQSLAYLFSGITTVFYLLIQLVDGAAIDVPVKLVDLDLDLVHANVGLLENGLVAVQAALGHVGRPVRVVLQLVDFFGGDLALLVGREPHAVVAHRAPRLGALAVGGAAAGGRRSARIVQVVLGAGRRCRQTRGRGARHLCGHHEWLELFDRLLKDLVL